MIRTNMKIQANVAMSESLKQFVEESKSRKKFFSVYGNENQLVRITDSLATKCNHESFSIYIYKHIMIKNKNQNSWDRFGLIEEIGNAKVIYKINEDKYSKIDWKIDYNISKNILGYNCHKAKSKDNEDVFAWVTLEIPYKISPVSHFSFPGVVLEFHDGSVSYFAKNIKQNNESDFVIHLEKYKIITFETFKDFSEIVTNSSRKLSSEEFKCIN